MTKAKKPKQFEREERVPEASRMFAVNLVDRFLSRRNQTDPNAGPASAHGKDIEALLTIQQMKFYFSMLADWALNHQVGLALESKEFVPLQPSETREHPEYVEKRAAVDSHQHEIAGAEFDWYGNSSDEAPRDPVFERRVLINMLDAIRTGNHVIDSVFRHAAEALRALDFGEVDPLFQPRPTGLTQPAHSRMRAQLRALAHVEYFYERQNRTGKNKAMETVAEAYGVSVSTLKGWAKDTRIKLGELHVSRELAYAKYSAQNAMAALEESGDSTAMENYKDYDHSYGKGASVRSGRAFREIERARKANGNHG